MDEQEIQRNSNSRYYSNRRSSVVSLQRNSGMSRQRSLNNKRSMIQVMDLDGMDEESIQGGLFEQMLLTNQRNSFFRSSNNSQNSQNENSMEIEDSRNSNSFKRPSSNKPINHDCICQGNCMDSLCPCYQAPYQLCLHAYCCPKCIEIKLQYMQSNSNLAKNGCICKNSKCLKSYCKCYQFGKRCNPSLCKCQSCQNIDLLQNKNPNKQTKLKQFQPTILKQQQNPKNINKNIQNGQQIKNKVKNQPNKGQVTACSCKKSHCLKKYCCCYALGKECGEYCECVDCRNKYEEDEDMEEKQYERQRFGRVDSGDEMEQNDDIDKYFYEKNYDQEQMPMSMQFQHPDMTRSFQH